jgi:hypothetical protein
MLTKCSTRHNLLYQAINNEEEFIDSDRSRDYFGRNYIQFQGVCFHISELGGVLNQSESFTFLFHGVSNFLVIVASPLVTFDSLRLNMLLIFAILGRMHSHL